MEKDTGSLNRKVEDFLQVFHVRSEAAEHGEFLERKDRLRKIDGRWHHTDPNGHEPPTRKQRAHAGGDRSPHSDALDHDVGAASGQNQPGKQLAVEPGSVHCFR